MDYQIVHAIEGRLRLRIAQLATDPGIGSKLQGAIESMHFVTNVRVNSLAESIVVTYKPKLISQAAVQACLAEVFAQISPPPAPPTSKKPEKTASTPYQQPASPLSVNLEADPWDDSTETEQNTTAPLTHTASPLEEAAMAQTSSQVDSAEFAVNTPLPEMPEIPEIDLGENFYSTSMLAKRLGVTAQAVTRRRSKPDFSEWSQMQDPDAVAWRFEADSKSFRPIDPPARQNQSDPKKKPEPSAAASAETEHTEAKGAVRETLESVVEQAVGPELSKVMIGKIEHVGQGAAQAVVEAQGSLIKLGETTLEILGEAIEVISNKSRGQEQKETIQDNNTNDLPK